MGTSYESNSNPTMGVYMEQRITEREREHYMNSPEGLKSMRDYACKWIKGVRNYLDAFGKNREQLVIDYFNTDVAKIILNEVERRIMMITSLTSDEIRKLRDEFKKYINDIYVRTEYDAVGIILKDEDREKMIEDLNRAGQLLGCDLGILPTEYVKQRLEAVDELIRKVMRVGHPFINYHLSVPLFEIHALHGTEGTRGVKRYV